MAFYPKTTAPTGWLKANGAAISRTTYATLFGIIGTTFGVGDGSTTFNLPDLRGEWLRGLDDGRGVDSARALGSAQGDQNKSHTHTGSSDSTGAHAHTLKVISGTGSIATHAGTAWDKTTSTAGLVDSAGAHSHTITIGSDGGTEVRVRNVALSACIKF